MRLLPTALALSLAFTALPATAQTQPAPGDVPAVSIVKSDDAAMNAAIADAQRTLPEFFRHFANPAADESKFEVKFNIGPGDRAEYIWAYDLRYEGDTLTGVLVDDAILVPKKGGDRVPIPTKAIVDWGYMKNGVMQGNRTMRAMIDRLTPDQQASIRQAFGW